MGHPHGRHPPFPPLIFRSYHLNTTMRPRLVLPLITSLSLMAPAARTEEPSPEIAGLQQAASEIVSAFKAKDAGALAKPFTEEGELCDLNGENLISGREQIAAHDAEYFAGKNASSLAIEVTSVRLAAPTLAIEDDTAHFTTPGSDAPRSTAYTAVLMKNGEVWQIASTRTVRDVTDDAGQLADLAEVIAGEWTAMNEGLRLDLAFGWDDTGNFITEEMLTTSADGDPGLEFTKG